MKSKKLIVSMLCVAVSGLFAFAVGFQAQSSESLKVRSGAPLAEVAKFESAFTENLNRPPSGAPTKGNTPLGMKWKWPDIAGKKVYKEFVDYYLWNMRTTARFSQKEVVQLSDAQLADLKKLIQQRFDTAIKTKNTASLGEGQLDKDFFTGKLLAPAGRRFIDGRTIEQRNPTDLKPSVTKPPGK